MAKKRKNEATFGRVRARVAWGHSLKERAINLDFDPAQVAVLAGLCQAAVAEHYSSDRRWASVREEPIQFRISYGAGDPVISLRRATGYKRSAQHAA